MSRRAEYIARQSRDSSTFDNTYQTLGTSLASPAIVLKIINNSDQDIDVSTDGSTPEDFVPSGSFFLYDIRTNHGIEDQFAFDLGTQFYIKGAAAGTGSVYLIALKERGT